MALTPDRSLITFACGAPEIVPGQADVLEELADAVEKQAFVKPVQLVVRTHPGRVIPGVERIRGKKFVVIDEPSPAYGATAASGRWDGSRRDEKLFLSLIKHSDVFINCFSTTTIDAAVLDRPVINIAYDGRQRLPYYGSSLKHYDFTHYKPIVKSGGASLVRSQMELHHEIDAYLADPKRNAEGRRRIAEQQGWRLDGNAGARIAKFLLDALTGVR